MCRIVLSLAILAFMQAAGAAQSPTFEVASIKRHPDIQGRSDGVRITPEQLEAMWIPVQVLIAQAYGVSLERIVGLPQWARTERYDVRARTAKPSSRQEVNMMLQALLAERLAIRVHRETREMEVYALVLSKPGSLGRQLQRVTVDCATNTLTDGSGLFPADARPPCGNIISNVRFKLAGGPSLMRRKYATVTMEVIAAALGSVGRPVVDRTGLAGTFDVELEYLSENEFPPFSGASSLAAPRGSEPLSGPSLRDALKEQLGLELRSDRASLDYLVIDSLQRPTAD